MLSKMFAKRAFINQVEKQLFNKMNTFVNRSHRVILSTGMRQFST